MGEIISISLFEMVSNFAHNHFFWLLEHLGDNNLIYHEQHCDGGEAIAPPFLPTMGIWETMEITGATCLYNTCQTNIIQEDPKHVLKYKRP